MNVGVDRNHELRRRDRPQSQIHAVCRTNHPAGIENEALARTASARIADQVPHAALRGVPAKRVGKQGQRLAKVPAASLVEAGKRRTQRAALAQQLASTEKHERQVLTPVDAMHESTQPPLELLQRIPRYSFSGARPQARKRAGNALARRHRVPKCKARRD